MNSDFRNLEVWQLAMDLADQVYDAAETLPRQELFVLSAQMRGAALSIPANIAEGKGRWSLREYRQFVRHARASALELQTHILFAARRHYLTPEIVAQLMAQAEKVVKKVNALISYLNRKTLRPPAPTTHDPNGPATSPPPPSATWQPSPACASPRP